MEGWPPSPALRVNHDLTQKGIPSDSAKSENALVLLSQKVADRWI
jgi:hypothetical protein